MNFPNQQPSEEEKKIHQQYSERTIQTAVLIGAALWLIPTAIHFIKRATK
ncbi:TOM (translocase of outer membrane) complex component [Komagataella phaffii CBS 7435]|uniref:TOM (Translocase of outer membrane) complex component n=2 Tax=Komagataella phaffii TaxID=460519 RepID=C4R7L9_KOMPG|nr:Hypothetical protein PAS_chr4_0350 [Komagataella phaffii GS115]CAH2451029.1 TOM (translocase of outer membrane) complex component [Komagataella phaffii CBS 7435]CAY71594.1 Hypothetical protein PAS_chr4_0350 [Komagataella phaffii GS115]SCV12394.1 TOM (translocase of outer membrane) complex component [Komagataella phaffii CBS 7435]